MKNSVPAKDEQHHILTLVIEKSADIPMIRKKVKLLSRSVDSSGSQTARLATAASEMARLFLNCCRGGKLELSFLASAGEESATFLQFNFHANRSCGTQHQRPGQECVSGDELIEQPPFPALQRVFDQIQIENERGALPLLVRCRSRLSGLHDTKKIFQRISAIRKELFTDTEESYMENLRAKHNEVVRLLREKTEQNTMLDQSNNELLELSNDLEALAQERTIIEMSLKIADQVRNPATVIGGLARQLLKKGGLTERAAEKIQQISLQAGQIDQVVQHFHAMANERGDLFTREDLALLVKEALQSCPTMGKRGITPEFTSGEQPVFIQANRRILKIALIHLLRYAALLSHPGSRLSVRVDSSKDYATVTIIDHGEGFVSTARKELRQPVEDKAMTGKPGLSLVRHILAEHQGQLQAERSTEDGQEGLLIMRFPLIWHEQGNTFSK